MIKLKKIVLIVALAILLVSIFGTNEVYANFHCGVNISANTSVTVGQRIVIRVNISNISGDNGLFAVGAFIDYDKDMLEYKTKRAVGDFEASTLQSSGKFLINRSIDSYLTTNSTIAEYEFEAKKTGSTTIKLLGVEASNAEETIKLGGNQITINIESKIEPMPPPTPTPTPAPTPNPTPNPTPVPTPNNNQGNNGQASRPNGGNNTETKKPTTSGTTTQNPNQENTEGEEPETTPEITPTPSPTQIVTQDTDNEETQTVKLSKVEGNNKEGIIYILIALVVVIIIIIILLICYARRKNRDIRKLEKGK